jgi:small subunit ribosomal protein S21
MSVNVRIVVGKDESIEKALRKFKKACERAGIKKECRARERYEKPSDVIRREKRKAERNRSRDERQSELER